MGPTVRWSRALVVIGLIALLLGTADPLEGSIAILIGIAILALEARRSGSRHRRVLVWSFVLTAIGVAEMWGISAVGGLGGSTGRSLWWALLLVPYPIGWLLGIVGGGRRTIDVFAPAATSPA